MSLQESVFLLAGQYRKAHKYRSLGLQHEYSALDFLEVGLIVLSSLSSESFPSPQ